MKLATLLTGLVSPADRLPAAAMDMEITAVCYDSRTVVPGALFVAIEGFSMDGHGFVRDALERGAAAVVCRRPVEADAVVVRVDNPRAVLAVLASRFHGQPADRLCLIGVTGTSGKTTVTYLLEKILAAAGLAVGVIGTINYRYAGTAFANPVTTPESADLQAIFRQMADGGVTHVVMEVSSHALELSRVDECRFDAAVFTNLSHDHLDFHATMEAYWRTKRRLFAEYLKPVDATWPVRAVVNNDTTYGAELAAELGSAAIRTTVHGSGDVVPRTVACDLSGIRGQIATPAGDIAIDSPLVGDFNLENILSAVGAALALKIAPAVIAAGINAGRCVPGRLERIDEGGERFIFVDYSHKPDALENAIAALRRLTHGRLITVFGCGGDRDRTKRPVMGEIAARSSDLTVVTSDNPRSEDPQAIIDEIEAGVRTICTRRLVPGDLTGGWNGRSYLIDADRRAAIGHAIRAALPGDAVLIAGKGHETYQILGDRTIHFDDREVAREVLAGMATGGG
jgi:UDP-N-acetylmuramoyl-L-alanyl-D-glutamate--2,6-diaminopimelate ligase